MEPISSRHAHAHTHTRMNARARTRTRARSPALSHTARCYDVTMLRCWRVCSYRVPVYRALMSYSSSCHLLAHAICACVCRALRAGGYWPRLGVHNAKEGGCRLSTAERSHRMLRCRSWSATTATHAHMREGGLVSTKMLWSVWADIIQVNPNVVIDCMPRSLVSLRSGLGAQIISDGGCTNPGDVAKAFGGGMCMLVECACVYADECNPICPALVLFVSHRDSLMFPCACQVRIS